MDTALLQRIHEAVDDVLRVEDGSCIRRFIAWKSVAGFPLNGAFQKTTGEPGFTN
jgi:hypothetical protein